MKSTVSGLQRTVGIGGAVTFFVLLGLGYPIYLSLEPQGTFAAFVVEPLAIELMILGCIFVASVLIAHPIVRFTQVLTLILFGWVTLAGADVDSLTGVLIIGIGVILAAQYGYFRTLPKLKIGAVTLAVLIALALQASQHWSSVGVSQTILAFLYSATAVLGLIAAYVIVWRYATSEIATRQAELEAAVEERTAKLSKEVTARFAAEHAAREAAAEAERLATERLALLQEVHHRAKNSLQMALTLLDGMDISSPESLDKTIDQVRAIGLVYDLVDASEEWSAISLEEYLESLVAHLRMVENGSAIQIWFQPTAELRSRLEATVNLGLMIIEIVRIAKLSLTESDDAIVVSEELSDDCVLIEISHGGHPVSADVDPDAGDLAKTGLLIAFVHRLHVNFSIERGERNRWVLRIPLEVLVVSDQDHTA